MTHGSHVTGIGEKVMWTAAVSAALVPICRNSQKGVKKLLMAVAAHGEGLQQSDVTILHQVVPTRCPGPTPTHAV